MGTLCFGPAGTLCGGNAGTSFSAHAVLLSCRRCSRHLFQGGRRGCASDHTADVRHLLINLEELLAISNERRFQGSFIETSCQTPL